MAAAERAVLVLALGPERIGLAELWQEDGRTQIRTLGEFAPPENAFDSGLIANGAAIGEAVSGFLSRHRPGTNRTVVLLPEATAVTQLVKLPQMPRADMLGAVRSSAERYAVFAEHEISVDCTVVESLEEEGAAKVNVLLAATRQAMVDHCLALARAANLELIGIEPMPVAAIRAALPRLSDHGVTAVAIVGKVKSDIYVFQGRVPKMCYSANAGVPETMTPAEGQDWLTPPKDAAHPPDPFTAPPQLYSELTHCFRYYQHQYPSEAVDKVIIAVDHSHAPEMVAQLAGQLQLPVELLRPDDTVKFPQDTDAKTVIDSRALMLAALLGAAQARFDGDRAHLPIDLSPRLTHVFRPFAPAVALGAAGIVALLAAALVWGVSLNRQIDTKKTSLAQTQSEITGLGLPYSIALAKLQQLDALRTEVERERARLVLERAVQWSWIMRDLSDRLPGGMWLTQVNSPDADRIRIIGISKDRETIPDGLAALRQSPYLVNVVLGSMAVDDQYAGGRTVVRFELDAGLNRGLKAAQLAAVLSPPPRGSPVVPETAPAESPAGGGAQP
jgi:Tfp pilus assembly protein PilN